MKGGTILIPVYVVNSMNKGQSTRQNIMKGGTILIPVYVVNSMNKGRPGKIL